MHTSAERNADAEILTTISFPPYVNPQMSLRDIDFMGDAAHWERNSKHRSVEITKSVADLKNAHRAYKKFIA
jgi:hypothetical protein